MAVIEASVAGGESNVGGSWVGGVAPGENDDVVLGAASGSITCSVAPTWKSLESAEGYKGTLKQNSGIPITLKGKNAAGWSWRWQGGTFTRGTASTGTILESSIAGNYKVRGGGQKFGNLKLVGSTSAIVMLLEDVVKAGEVKMEGGKIDANGFNQEWDGGFATAVAKTKILNIEGITVKMSGTGSIWAIGGSNFTLEGTTSTLEITDNSVTTKTIKMGELTTYGTILVTATGAAKLKIEESFTCKALGYVSGSLGSGKKYVFKEGITVTIGEFVPTGEVTMGNELQGAIWESSVAGKAFFIKGTGGIYPAELLNLKDSHASGGTFYAGSRGTNTSGNEGWIFHTYHAKTLTATQPSTPSFGPTIDLRTLSATQSQSVTFGPTIDYRKLTVTQAQSPVFSRAVSRALTVTQSSSPTRTTTPARALTATTQSQAATLQHLFISKLLTITQASAIPGGERVGKVPNRTFSATQPSTSTRTVVVARTLALQQASTVTEASVLAHAFALTQASASAVSKTVTHLFSLEQPSSGAMGKDLPKSMTLTQSQVVARTTVVSRRLALEQAQAISRKAALSRTLKCGQAQEVEETTGKAGAREFVVGQPSEAQLEHSGLTLRTLTSTQASSTALARVVSRHLRASQSSSPRMLRSPTRTLSAPQTSAVVYVARIGKPIPAEQASSASIQRVVGRVLFVTQGQNATLVGQKLAPFEPGHLNSTIDHEALASDTLTGVTSSTASSTLASSDETSIASSAGPVVLAESGVE